MIVTQCPSQFFLEFCLFKRDSNDFCYERRNLKSMFETYRIHFNKIGCKWSRWQKQVLFLKFSLVYCNSLVVREDNKKSDVLFFLKLICSQFSEKIDEVTCQG